MVIQQIESEQVISLCDSALGLDSTVGVHDATFLAALVRRAAGMVCPCSPGTLKRAVLDGLFRLADDPERLAEDVETAVDKATIAGDLLELNQVATEDPNVKGTWLFAAPPAFVVRPSGSVFLLGVSPEGPSALSPILASRIRYDRHYRTIHPQPGENLAQSLRELGLLELSDQNWHKPPRQEEARNFRDRLQRELQAQGPSGKVTDLKILDGDRDPAFYNGRWVTAQGKSGCFVARRPQAYGAALWGVALLENGALQKFLDLPPKKDRFRGSDFAWRLQMAIDAVHGTPQKYRKRSGTGGARLDFFSPIPLWAERRLAVIGNPIEREKCLFSYLIPEREAEAEEAFLKNYLWLEPVNTHGGS